MEIIIFTKKTIKFFQNYLLNDPVFVLKYGLAYFKKNYTPIAIFYSKEELSKELQAGKSIIRIGDGEIGLLHGRDIGYQKYHPLLKEYLLKSIENYSKDSNYILSIPIFVNFPNKRLEEVKDRKRCWLPLKIEFFRRFNKDLKYLDAHFFYYRDLMLNFFKENLKDKDIVVIAKKEYIENLKKTDLSIYNLKSVNLIEGPTENSFDKFEEIQTQINEVLKSIEDKKNVRLLISTGPTSKALVYKYAQENIVSYDIGFGLCYLWDEKDYTFVI